MLQYYIEKLSESINCYPMRRAHHVGTSVVVTLDPSHVKRLRIDDLTFFVQKPIENGILLEKRRLNQLR
jgi:hypothetical protein